MWGIRSQPTSGARVNDGSNVKGKAAEENIFICMCVNVTMEKRVRKTQIIWLGGPL